MEPRDEVETVSSPLLAVSTGLHGPCVILRLAGEVTGGTALLLHEHLAQVLALGGPPLLVVDMAQVTVLDGHGLALLSAADLRAVNDHGRMVLAEVPNAVSGEFRALTTHRFRCAPSTAEAIVALTSGSSASR
ncbi:STAS domain-containing protein [Actinomadura rudentiformis]|uniref:STAS domain-containing protein n=1 Tax=Actinomadura rudentiformis TaxID=359158 RepID=UPI00178C23A7|nr:STAS domain-containing protein [Actinomadura rudentiformis]